MTKRSDNHHSPESGQGDAMRIACSTPRLGKQTKLVAQGVQKGIEQYKKQQNTKVRELDKKLKKVRQQPASPELQVIEVQEKVIYRQHWLPWV